MTFLHLNLIVFADMSYYRVMGKILAAAWRGSKFEIQGVLREVCDRVLNDKKVKLEKRVDRAHALVLAGSIYLKVCSPPRQMLSRD